MLRYFPNVYPDELLYSLMARYIRHTASPAVTRANTEVLGKRLVLPSLEFPSGIDHLDSLDVLSSTLSREHILDDMTLFNYMTAYTRPKLVERIRSRVLTGEVRDWYVMLGYAAFKVDRVTRLRFCHHCADEMVIRYGELYWHKLHQLPSVLVCPLHRSSLSHSKVDIRHVGRHDFIAADRETCPVNAELLIPEAWQDEMTMARLNALALASVRLCEPDFQRKTLGGWTTYYRRRFEALGLASASGRVKLNRLTVGLRSHYGNLLQWFPELHQQASLPWLGKLARKQRTRSHPLQHLLLDGYLDFLASRQVPSESGPWACRNPLASHYGSKRIRSYSLHPNHGHQVAVFRCDCGYVYTRTVNMQGMMIGKARFQEYGPLLKPVLAERIAAGHSLRSISRAVELDPKTVVRLATESGIHTSWRTGTYQTRPSRQKGQSTPRSTHRLKTPTMYGIDWKRLDTCLSSEVRRAANVILKTEPPVKLTMAEIERHTDRRGWFSKRLAKLPKTRRTIYQRLESHETYRIRRIEWAIRQLATLGDPLHQSTVIRKANLRSNAMPLVDAAIQRFQTIRPCV